MINICRYNVQLRFSVSSEYLPFSACRHSVEAPQDDHSQI